MNNTLGIQITSSLDGINVDTETIAFLQQA